MGDRSFAAICMYARSYYTVCTCTYDRHLECVCVCVVFWNCRLQFLIGCNMYVGMYIRNASQ